MGNETPPISGTIEYVEAVPKDGGNYSFEARSLPVTPLTDERIADLPFPERLAKVREMQGNYHQPHIREKITEKGMKEREDTLSLGAVISDLYMRDYDVASAHRQLAITERAHSEELNAIRGGQRGKHHKKERLEEETKRWLSQKKQFKGRVYARERLRDAVIDGFIRDFFLTPGGLEKLKLAAEDLTAMGIYRHEDIIAVLEKLRIRLKTKMSPEQARFLAYKDINTNFLTPSRAEVLQALIMEAVEVPRDKDSLFAGSLKGTVQDLFDFYWLNLDRLYEGEETPMVAYVYDFLYAASLPQDRDILFKAAEMLIPRLRSKEEIFYQQFVKMHKASGEEIMVMVEKLKNEQIQRQTNEEAYLQANSPIPRQALIGKSYDRMVGFDSAFSILAEIGMPNYYERFRKQYMEEEEKEDLLKETVMLAGPSQEAVHWRSYLANYYQGAYTLDRLASTMMGKNQYLTRKAELAGIPPTKLLDKGFNLSLLAQTADQRIPESSRATVFVNQLIHLMFIKDAPEDLEKVKRMVAANRALFEKIRFEYNYFVPEWGIEYPSSKSQKLREKGIRSLRIYPSREYKGQKIVIETDFDLPEGKKAGLTLFLDREGQLCYETGDPLSIPIWLRCSLEDFLFKGLAKFTSGRKKQIERGRESDEVKPMPAEDEPPDEEYAKIPSWRKLVSTLQRQYTMQSASAVAHAQEMLRIYGVDIYEENLERRGRGLLKQGEFVTAVKPVGHQDEPDQLVYD